MVVVEKTELTEAITAILADSVARLETMYEDGDGDCYTPEVMKGIVFGMLSLLLAGKNGMTKKMWNKLPSMTDGEFATVKSTMAAFVCMVADNCEKKEKAE